MSLVEGQLSEDFFTKFPEITSVRASGVVEPNKFEWFLKNVSKLNKLTLINTSLPQTFMNNLPTIAKELAVLEVEESSDYDFDFITQFTRLHEFQANRKFEKPLNLAKKLLEKFSDLFKEKELFQIHSFTAKAFFKFENFGVCQFRSGLNEITEIRKESQTSFRLAFYQIEPDKLNDTDDKDRKISIFDFKVNKQLIFGKKALDWHELETLCENRSKENLD